MSPDRIVTIPNGVDGDRRTSTDRLAAREWLGLGDEFLFLSLARHCLQKNSFGLVAAFAEVAAAQPDAHLLIVGRPDDVPYHAQLLALRDSLPCASRVHIRDHWPRPAELLAAADAFVLDSFFEGWSLASMEALWCGLPVVLSEVGGAREQVGRDGERGYVVPNPLGSSDDVSWETMAAIRFAPQPNRAELADAMISVAADRVKWRAARPVLEAESRRRFHPDVTVAAHAGVLRSAAEKGMLPAGPRPPEPAVMHDRQR